MLLGAHVSTKGGLASAPLEGQSIGAEAIQIFTRNQVQWKGRPVGEDEASGFRKAMDEAGISMAIAHASYLLNLSSPVGSLLGKSRSAMRADMERCHALGIPYLVFHPGAHMGAGRDEGLKILVASLDLLFDETASLDVMPLLEVTAGQGSYLGSRFEDLAEVFSRLQRPERLGACLDTCHLLAAGYDITTEEGYRETLGSFDRLVGLSRVKAIHLNDAEKGLGSRLDRHAAIGEGFLGRSVFERLLNEPALQDLPMVLETPGGPEQWAAELRLLRGMVRPSGNRASRVS